ncbi:MAG: substrate-binding domain-containing protein [Epsilonproteobacteria bacterium]|nr:substrate-binding domain-containing protein [Campylobacterota bacterium]
MKLKKSLVALAAAAALFTVAEAREQVKIVGSSTVYPFSSAVAEELGATTDYKTPVVESTGSGGGMKLFCKGNGLDTPDITNASRRMKINEFKMCQENGVIDITEAVVGYDGIAFADSKKNKPFSVTKKQILLAVAADVPSKDGKSLIKNPYKKWSDIDAALPSRDIVVYGPPTSSGTRDAFEDMIMKSQTKKMDVYTNAGHKKYHKIRTDGVYVPSGENDNLIVQKLDKNPKAFGIFGYSFLEENSDKVQGTLIDGKEPTAENIGTGAYPLSRSLYFYIKNTHAKDVKSLDAFVNLFMADKMIGEEGILSEIGLISLPKAQLEAIQKAVTDRKKLTEADLAK